MSGSGLSSNTGLPESAARGQPPPEGSERGADGGQARRGEARELQGPSERTWRRRQIRSLPSGQR
eukprot:8024952-Alexandrium_andersonii.AAC.1